MKKSATHATIDEKQFNQEFDELRLEPIETTEQVIEEAKELDKKGKKDKNEEHVSFLETKDYILEQICTADVADTAGVTPGEDDASFVKYSKLNGGVEVVKSYQYNKKTYYPIIDKTYLMGGISLPSGVEDYNSTKEIVDEISVFINENCELPVFYQKLFPYLIMFYWVYEKFPFIPYLHFVGSTSTGKTTAMEVLGSISYKAIDTTGSLTIASLFRLATSWKGTMLVDEFDTVGENQNEMVSFLKAGVSNRLLYRTEGEVKKEVNAYIVKSPKYFTSENPISDAGLQSRTMAVKMEKSKRLLPLFKLSEYYQEARHIKNKLLLWRLRTFNTINLRNIKFGFPELQFFDRRVQQIITPIYYFSDEETKQEVINFAVEQEKETKRERRESLEGRVLEILVNLWDSDQEAQVKIVTSLMNESNIGYKSDLTEKKIGNVIRKVLGFDTETRGHDKLAWVIFNKEHLDDLRLHYGISPPDLSSAMTATPAKDDKINEITII